MAQQVAVYDSPGTLCKIPDNVSFAEAATTERWRTPCASQGERAPGRRDRGGLRHGRHWPRRHSGVPRHGMKLDKLIAVDTSDVRLNKALEVGADHVFNAKKQDVVGAITALCGTTKTALDEVAPKVDVVCDCVGYINRMPGVRSSRARWT